MAWKVRFSNGANIRRMRCEGGSLRVLYAAYSQEAVHTVLDEGAATMQALERASPGAAGGDGVLQTVSAGLVTSANVFLAIFSAAT